MTRSRSRSATRHHFPAQDAGPGTRIRLTARSLEASSSEGEPAGSMPSVGANDPALRGDASPGRHRGAAPRGATSEDAAHRRGAQLNLQLKRAYEPPSAQDGVRILVDRLWPRGLTKAAAAVDRWMRDLAPSTELRRWFGHDPARWERFRREYTRELSLRGDLLEEVRTLARRGRVTLVFSARDETHNDAVALLEVLRK